MRHFNPRGIQAVRAEASDPKAVLAELHKAFGDFRARHEGRYSEIDSRMDELEKLMQRIPAGGGGRADRPEAAEVAAFIAAVERRDVTEAEASGKDFTNYNAAALNYFRKGEAALQPDVRAEMSVGSDPGGGYWVAPQLASELKRRLFDTSAMRRLATVITVMNADSIKFITDTNDATSGGWVAESASRGETATPDIGEQTIYLREQYANPQVTQKLLDMTSFPVDQWLTEKIADKFSRTENTAFVSGDGVDRPRGFLNYKGAAVTTDDDSRAWGLLQYVPTGASGSFPDVSGIAGAKDADALITTQHKLKSQYRAGATWVMNRATAAVVRKLKDGDGRYLWSDSLIQGQPPMLLGSPVEFFEDLPDIAADSFSIAYGDFRRAYTIIDGPGFRVLRDPYTTKGKVKFYATRWTGGDITDWDAVKLVKFGTS